MLCSEGQQDSGSHSHRAPAAGGVRLPRRKGSTEPRQRLSIMGLLDLTGSRWFRPGAAVVSVVVVWNDLTWRR